jgi:glutamate racemase
MPQRAIGVFDSGLGGLSVLKAIHQQLPHDDLIYVADSAHAPYGDKDKAYILERCETITRFFLEQNVKAVVIACNTATAVAADYLRQQYPALTIIAMEPAVRPAALHTQTGSIGIFATRQTIQSERLEKLIQTHASHLHVTRQACPGLVEHVEQGQFDTPDVKALLSQYLEPMVASNVDTLVLGCTHYPFLRATIQQLSRDNITILETSDPVARQLKYVLQNKQLHRSHAEGSVQLYTSHQPAYHQATIDILCENAHHLTRLPAVFC